MSRRVYFGVLTAFFGAILALDASTFRPAEYPLMKKLFDGDWIIARNALLSFASAGTAVCGYLVSHTGDKPND